VLSTSRANRIFQALSLTKPDKEPHALFASYLNPIFLPSRFLSGSITQKISHALWLVRFSRLAPALLTNSQRDPRRSRATGRREIPNLPTSIHLPPSRSPKFAQRAAILRAKPSGQPPLLPQQFERDSGAMRLRKFTLRILSGENKFTLVSADWEERTNSTRTKIAGYAGVSAQLNEI
jgi:hypothetical protein